MRPLRSRTVLVLAALLAAGGVGGCLPPEPEESWPDAAPGLAGEAREARRQERTAPAPGPEAAPPVAPPVVRWPAGWRLVESGASGTPGDAFAWYRLEAGGLPASAAAAAALEALRPAAGEVAFEHVSSPQSSPGRAVAQLRGARFRGAVDARTSQGATTVQVLLEMPGG